MPVDTDFLDKALRWGDDLSMDFDDGQFPKWDAGTAQFIPGSVAAGVAPLDSPAFTGNPTAPTPPIDDNDTSIATTAWVMGQAGSIVPNMDGTGAAGISTRWSRQDHVHPTDTSRAPLASPAFTGTPTAPTAAADTNTTQLATTAFVLAQASALTPLMDAATPQIGGSLRYARADHVHPTDSSRAPLASPALTGTPTAPTAAVDTNTTQIATTAFVLAQAASATPLMDGTGAVGTSTRYARADHVHPTDTSRMSATVAWGGDLNGSGSAPGVAKIAGNTTRFGLGGELRSLTGVDHAGITSNFNDATNRLIDTTKPGWSFNVNASDDRISVYRAPPTAGVPAFSLVCTISSAGLLDAVGGLQTNGVAALLASALSNTAPNMDGSASSGTSATVSRADHTHPADTSKLNVSDLSRPVIGSMMVWAGTGDPNADWMVCDGRAVSRTTYATLFGVIGTTYGAGDGSTTFNIPDTRSRAIVGAGQGTGLTNRARGATGGEENHTLTTAEMPSHSHDVVVSRGDAGTIGGLGKNNGTAVNTTFAGAAQAVGGGDSHNNMQPWVALNHVIRVL